MDIQVGLGAFHKKNISCRCCKSQKRFLRRAAPRLVTVMTVHDLGRFCYWRCLNKLNSSLKLWTELYRHINEHSIYVHCRRWKFVLLNLLEHALCMLLSFFVALIMVKS
jgi:hypothetical protein